MGWWRQIFRTRAEDWTYGKLQPSQVPGGEPSRQVAAEGEYLSAFVHSLHVCDVRRGVSRFYGAVHSLVSVPPSRLGERAEFHSLTTPENLRNLDARNVNRVVTLDQRILGPVPYRGGDVEIELGLFSVKSADLADPFLSVLEDLASSAGVAFVAVARPFVEPLKRGIGLLTGSDGPSILEIGLAKVFNPAETGHFVVMRAPKGQVELDTLSLDEDGTLLRGGKAVRDYPYVVISIQASPERPDWRLIPDVAKAYAELEQAVAKQKVNDIRDALSAFKVAVHWSPDLLPADSERIYELVKAQTGKTVDAVQTAAGPPTLLPRLDELDLPEAVEAGG